MKKKHSEALLIVGGAAALGVAIFIGSRLGKTPISSSTPAPNAPVPGSIPGANPNSDDPNLAPANQT